MKILLQNVKEAPKGWFSFERNIKPKSPVASALILLIGGFSLTLAIAAQASPVTYIGVDPAAITPGPLSMAAEAAFNAAAGSLGPPISTVDFEVAALGPLPITAGGVILKASPGTFVSAVQICPLFGCNTTMGGSRYVYLGNAGWLTLTFPSDIQAFGAYLTGVQITNNSVDYFDGIAESIPLPGFAVGGVEFVGFINGPHPNGPSVECFREVTIRAPIDFVGVDDVRYVPCQGAPVSEPLPLSLVGLGLLCIAGTRRRKLLTR